MDILLSVIVPIYNVKEYVEKCIESICNQTYQNLEIILVDDGSTDGSGDICDIFADKDQRVKVVHKTNGGLISARKAGAEIATGDYVISVDGDDWIDNTRFENLVNKALIYNPSMAYMSGHYKEYGKESVLIKGKDIEGVYDKEQIRTKLMRLLAGEDVFLERKMEFAQWLWCVKKNIYLQNQMDIDDKIKMGEDVVTIFSCILDSDIIVCIEEASYHYVQRQGSITFRKDKWEKGHAELFYKQIKKAVLKYKINNDVRNVAVQYIYHNLMLTNYKKLYDFYSDNLFPYPIVKRESRIIIYGAGNIGVEIVNAIDKNPRYEIVAWIDKNKRENNRSKHKIEEISVIHKKEYDYIIIAILVAETSIEIKRKLVLEGISVEKVVLMDSTLMKFNDLEIMMK